MTQGQFFKRSLTGLNSEYSFSKAEEPSPSYYLHIAGGRIKNYKIHTFLKGVCAMFNANSIIQGSDSVIALFGMPYEVFFGNVANGVRLPQQRMSWI